MSALRIPVTATLMPEWVRKCATTVNQMLADQQADEVMEARRSVQPFEMRSSAPASPLEGRAYYDTTTHKAYVFDGTVFQPLW